MDMQKDPQTVFHSFVDLEEIHKHWHWFLALGLALVVVGTLAIIMSTAVTLVSVFVLGGLCLGGGVFQIINAFWARRWTGFFASLLMGILYAIAGLIFLTNPVEGAVTLSLVIAVFLFIGGIFRAISAIATRHDHWGWALFSGLLAMLLGGMIYSEWPASGLWIIGLFIGVDMLLVGWTWVLLSFKARQLVGPNPKM